MGDEATDFESDVVPSLTDNGGDLLLGVGLLGGAVACATVVAFLRMKLTPG